MGLQTPERRNSFKDRPHLSYQHLLCLFTKFLADPINRNQRRAADAGDVGQALSALLQRHDHHMQIFVSPASVKLPLGLSFINALALPASAVFLVFT